jgi:hypothetical protein
VRVIASPRVSPLASPRINSAKQSPDAARRRPRALRRLAAGGPRSHFWGCQEKYRRSTGENARQLQCKALQRREKSRRRRNRGEQGKNNSQNSGNSRTSGARADVRLCTPDAAQLWFPCKIQENYRAAFAATAPTDGSSSQSISCKRARARARSFFLDSGFWTLDSGLYPRPYRGGYREGYRGG